MERVSKPALLCIVPPYTAIEPPAGAAYLLAYAKALGCDDFGFLDLRLGVPGVYAPTYIHTGVFGECYVMDVPDLPLVLAVLNNFENRLDLLHDLARHTDRYCRSRGIPGSYLEDYLRCADRYLRDIADQIAGTRFIGFSTWTSNFLTTLLFAAHLKRLPHPPVVVFGGPQVTESRACAALALRSGVCDVVCIGEGEATLLDVYSRVSSHGEFRLDALPGTAVLDSSGNVTYGVKRPLLALHEIPVPAFDQMPLMSYQEAGVRAVPYHLSRGCTDRCVFCSEWKFWERFRPGEALGALDGVKRLNAEYGAEYISFTDSLLNGHPARLRQFAEGLVRDNVDIKWNGFMRANMDPETATLLKRSGCESVFVGIESMSDETLALMKKRRTEEHNVGALHSFLNAGIHVIAGVIPGFPKDDRTAFVHTVERLRSLQRTYRGLLRINVEPFVVSPAQPLFSSLADFGLQGIPWEDDVLNIAPQYRDITDGVYCAVEGSNQGIERVGRLRMAESMESDEPVRTDTFDYKGDESPTTARFTFDHLRYGWFLARIKGPSAWIYGFILNDREKAQLEELSSDFWSDEPDASAMRIALEAIADDHLVRPTQRPQLPHGGYFRTGADVASYHLSPYVIARLGGPALGHRLFVVDFFDASWKLVPAWHGDVIDELRLNSHTPSSLQRALLLRGLDVGVAKCVRVLNGLCEDGLVLVSPASHGDAPAVGHLDHAAAYSLQ